jgi:hypothetical protein
MKEKEKFNSEVVRIAKSGKRKRTTEMDYEYFNEAFRDEIVKVNVQRRNMKAIIEHMLPCFVP